MRALWLTTGFLANSGDAPAVEQPSGPPLVAGMRPFRRFYHRALEKAEDALETADDAATLAKAVAVAAPAFRGDAYSAEYEALRLRADRMAREEAAIERWQADTARAVLIMEFRALMLSIEAAANDDEEAAFALLLAA